VRAVIESARFAPRARILVISDVHGNMDYFTHLLDKVGLTNADELVLLGDMLEKGPESLAVLRFLMALSKKYRVHCVCGNCDGWHMEMDHPSAEADEFLRRYMEGEHGRRGLLAQMCAEARYPVTPEMDLDAMRKLLLQRFAPEFDFLRAMPHVLETEHYTFVHGGLPEGNPESWSDWDCMKNDYYLNQGRRFDKWVIVGHTPVMLYGGDITCANPIIDRESHIISIDGGCVLKDDGQLNALIIPRDGSEDFMYAAYDGFPTRRVAETQCAGEKSAYLRWGDNVVEVLERGEEFSRCRHTRTGYEMDILTKYLWERCGVTRCNDCTDYVLPLQAGDTVSVVELTSRGTLCKHRGVSGWYFGAFQ
jgi:hypothetical protein